MKKRNYIFQLPTLLVVILILSQCANPSYPTGGPKDKYPPVPIASSPRNHATSFQGKRIEVLFNEFFDLDNVSKNVIVSPPLKEPPVIRKRGKKLLIEFNEKLLPNTTYNIFFGQAIKDITEGNVLNNYQFAFSTGPVLDSLGLAGNVVDAFSLAPEEGVYVMLYTDNNDTVTFDSLPYKVIPKYISRTNKEGVFSLNNLAADNYKIFALKTTGLGYNFTLPTDKIAFLDSLIPAEQVNRLTMDTLFADTALRDSIAMVQQHLIDSLGLDQEAENTFFRLFLFSEEDTTQKLDNKELLTKGKLRFFFNQPARDLSIQSLNFPELNDYILEEFSKGGDTLTWYYKPIPVDTLKLLIQGPNFEADTIEVSLITQEEKKQRALASRRRKKEDEKAVVLPPIKFANNLTSSKLDLNKKLEFVFDFPLTQWDFDNTLFVAGEDTLSAQIQFLDSLHRHLRFDHEVTPETEYEVIIPDSVLTNLRGSRNDSIMLKYKSRVLEDYGVIYLDVRLPDTSSSYILQLTDEKLNPLQEMILDKSQTVEYKYLLPAKYSFRLIQDLDGTGKWLTGSYAKKREPAHVYYLGKELNLRANWDLEETWTPKFE